MVVVVVVVVVVVTFIFVCRAFGIVLRTTGEVHNECHLFAECHKEWPVNILVNVLNRYMAHKTS